MTDSLRHDSFAYCESRVRSPLSRTSGRALSGVTCEHNTLWRMLASTTQLRTSTQVSALDHHGERLEWRGLCERSNNPVS
jgi:hypothetical protein